MQTKNDQNHILIFDIGKTNKKLLVFNEDYEIQFELTIVLPELKDEDGFYGEDINALQDWMMQAAIEVITDPRFSIKAINYSGYGASFVLLTKDFLLAAPLYNYLKPLDPAIKNKFFSKYSDEKKICTVTCSPSLGNLNSGLQLYRLKNEKPELYAKIHTALHLPQYLSYIFTKEISSEITSIGCHTMLWDFDKFDYHDWVKNENLTTLFPENKSADTTYEISLEGKKLTSGIGIHDSSGALIPYLKLRENPFILLSTGTWCIALNPFAHTPLTQTELLHDCLCYISFEGKPVKASRLFLGHEHQEQVIKIAKHFNEDQDFYKLITFENPFPKNIKNDELHFIDTSGLIKSGFEKRDLNDYSSARHAYHQLVLDMVITQIESIKMIHPNPIGMDILVDGGFTNNEIFMNLLANQLPLSNIYSAEIPQASAIGAAMIMHRSWNSKPITKALIKLKPYKKI